MSAFVPNPLIPDTAVSVGGLTTYLTDLLEQDRHLRNVWVIGEVSSATLHPNGIFFTLSDPQTAATIRCVVWNSVRSQLMQVPIQGEQVIVLGSLRVYKNRGEYQLTIHQVLPAGAGLKALQYRQLRSRLAAEGLFDADRKRPLPTHPQAIAVVTSPQAAAWGDIQRTLAQRYPGLQVLLSPATVQGEEAPLSIVAAIERVARDGRAEVVILARGGGAVEDLECFNDERVVRAIADSPIPIITGIGHQRDESLADLVADVCAHTPTAAAEIAVPAQATLHSDHEQRMRSLILAVERRLQAESHRCQQLRNRLTRLPTTSQRLQKAIAHCQLLREKLSALDPQAVLARGYAVVRRDDGSVVRAHQDLMPEQPLTIQLQTGKIKVQIVEIIDDLL